mmetsp:Transcript_6776/g.11831  ORF Transcript_6776/g.11831 Transcript_6776/m.11831 type:complete len:284 (+) Transcript_6776:48-899(+)
MSLDPWTIGAAAAIPIASLFVYFKFIKKSPQIPKTKEIQLFTFGRWKHQPHCADASPFCLKLEAFLRLTGLQYKRGSAIQSEFKNPTGKTPFIIHDGKLIGDSTIIIDYLKFTFGDAVDIDQQLSCEEKSIAHAYISMIENNLYYILIFVRWWDQPEISFSLFDKVPFLLRSLIYKQIQSKTKQAIYSQGIGRFDRATIFNMGIKDMTAISSLLSDKQFFFDSPKPTTLDIVVYAIVTELLTVVGQSNAMIEHCKKHTKNLFAHQRRVHRLAFPELPEAPELN